MNGVLHLHRWRLHAEIAMARFGFWLPLSGLTLLVNLFLWLLVVPSFQKEITTQHQRLTALQALGQVTPAAEASPPDANVRNLALFEATLTDHTRQATILQSLFAMAKKQGLSVAQATYKNTHHPKNYYNTTQITLPLRGSYGAIRRFSMEALTKLPYCSIEEIAFKREGIGTDQVEAQLRMTLWLKPMSPITKTDSTLSERTRQ